MLAVLLALLGFFRFLSVLLFLVFRPAEEKNLQQPQSVGKFSLVLFPRRRFQPHPRGGGRFLEIGPTPLNSGVGGIAKTLLQTPFYKLLNLILLPHQLSFLLDNFPGVQTSLFSISKPGIFLRDIPGDEKWKCVQKQPKRRNAYNLGTSKQKQKPGEMKIAMKHNHFPNSPRASTIP